MSVKSRATITTDIATNLPDNTSGLIIPELLRGELTDLNDSTVNKTTDTNLMGVRIYDVTRLYYTGELTLYNGYWYQANSNTVVGAFDPAKWDALANNMYHASLVVETANVLILNGTPIDIVAAVTGKAIVVNHAVLTVNFATTPYATNTTLQLITDTANQPQLEFVNGLNASVTRKYLGRLKVSASGATDTQLIVTKSLKVQVQTGNPTAGDSQIKIDVFYTLL